ncbi:MAG TPA: hypothetical protein DEG71_01490 [Clostridiales bacterium]|nr:hypothetical protein [Clostridiales bacterium]
MIVERYNFSKNPKLVINYKCVGELLTSEGIGVFPVTVVDGKIEKTRSYLTNDEIYKFITNKINIYELLS